MRSKTLERSRESVTLRIDPRNDEWLRLYAALQRKSLSDVINDLLEEKRLELPIKVGVL